MPSPLDELLKDRGLTFAAVERCGVSHATLWGWRTGRRRLRRDALARLSVILGVPFDEVAVAALRTFQGARRDA